MINIKGFINASIKAKGPVLYYLSDFEAEYRICSIYWKVDYKGKAFLVDTGIKDIDYMNKTTRSGSRWERKDEIVRFEKIDYIFPTHFHYDHCSGIFEYDDAKIIITEKSYKNLFDDKYSILFEENIYNKDILKRIKYSKERCLIVKDGEEIEEGVEISWVGGHTPCSQTIIFRADLRYDDIDYRGVVFAGDMIFTFKNIDEKIPGGLIYDLMDFYDFYDRFAEKGLMIIPGHDCSAVRKINESVVRK